MKWDDLVAEPKKPASVKWGDLQAVKSSEFPDPSASAGEQAGGPFRSLPFFPEPTKGLGEKIDAMTPEQRLDHLKSIQDAPKESFQQGIREAGQGFGQLGVEVGQKIGISVSPEEYTANVLAQRKAYQEKYGEIPGQGVTKFAGNSLPYLTIPGGPGGSLAARVGYGSAVGAGVGATQFVNPGESRAINTGVGAAAGGGLPIVTEGVSRAAGKFINALKGGTASPAKQEIIELGKKHGVPVYYPDVGGPASQKIGTALEEVPVLGMSGARQVQQEAAKASALKIAEQFKSAIGSDDVSKLQQQSLKKNLGNVTAVKKQLYDKVSALADDLGNVKTESMNQTTQAIIGKELSKKQEYVDKGLIESIKKYTVDPESKFSDLQLLRATLGERIKALQSGKAPTQAADELNALYSIKRGLEKDMESFASNSGKEISEAWKVADNFYKQNYAPLKNNKMLQKMIKSGEPDRIHDYFIKPGYGDRAQNYHDMLTDTGRAATQYKIINDAVSKSLNAETGVFSPAKFAQEINSKKEAVSVFFKGDSNELITGYSRLMKAVERAGQFAENPPTGKRAIPYIVGGGAVAAANVSPTAAAIIGGVTYGTKLLFTRPAGRNLLLAASKLKFDDPKMAQLAAQYATQLRAEMAKQAVSANNSGKSAGQRAPLQKETQSEQSQSP